MLLGLFKNVNECVSDSPRIVIFGKSNRGLTSKLKSPSNEVQRYTEIRESIILRLLPLGTNHTMRKKSGRSKRSVTAPSAIGIDPIFPPLNRLVRRLLALSNKFIFVFGSSVPVD
uniref:Putative ovule protein n=1 Tax=Solanum chacoense TaxID=4108 RepID=A0A0V0HHF8_SOLCH